MPDSERPRGCQQRCGRDGSCLQTRRFHNWGLWAGGQLWSFGSSWIGYTGKTTWRRGCRGKAGHGRARSSERCVEEVSIYFEGVDVSTAKPWTCYPHLKSLTINHSTVSRKNSCLTACSTSWITCCTTEAGKRSLQSASTRA